MLNEWQSYPLTPKQAITKRCNRAAKSGVLKWLIFRRRRLIVTVRREGTTAKDQ
jgi:hypothetical protein